MKSRAYKVRKVKVLVKRETPGGDLNALEATSEQQLPFFSVKPDKTSKHIIMKYSQKHSESTFGSAHF